MRLQGGAKQTTICREMSCSSVAPNYEVLKTLIKFETAGLKKLKYP